MLVTSGEWLFYETGDPDGVFGDALAPNAEGLPEDPEDLISGLQSIIAATGRDEFDIQGCQIILRRGPGRDICSDPEMSFWKREQTFDLRLVRTSIRHAEVRYMAERDTDVVSLPIEPKARERLRAIMDIWHPASSQIIRQSIASGNNKRERIRKLRHLSASLEDRLFERFSRTTLYCEWGTLASPEINTSDVLLFVNAGDGERFHLMLHRLKRLQCPFDRSALRTD